MGKNKMLLWYKRPAEQWEEALPIGNGRLGGMVHGGVWHERISLNEDTCWSGTPREPKHAESAQYLDEARRLIFEGQYRKAQTIIEEHMLGPWSHAYQSMGDLDLEFIYGPNGEGRPEATDYRRELDLRRGITSTTFSVQGTRYTRETFVSAVDQVMVIRIACDKPRGINFECSLRSPGNYSSYKIGRDRIVLRGQTPAFIDPMFSPTTRSGDSVIFEEDKGLQYEVHVKAITDGGYSETHGSRMLVKQANAVTLLLTAATSFNGYDKDPVQEGNDPKASCDAWLAAAEQFTYAEMKDRHIADFQPYFDRVELELHGDSNEDLPTDERIIAVRDGAEDIQLAALFFQFGRYLMISSSRPGTQPTTLQGIWNHMTKPPWSCNYTTNINTQMNYWPAEPCNLAEFHTPLFDMLEELRVAGAKMVKEYYHMRGWGAHHNVDIWRTTSPQGGPSKGPATWAYWPMAGPWLCQHLWEHYAYSGDVDFLRNRAYPIMKDAALFCLDYLVEDADGNLVSSPSTSPENTFIAPDGTHAAVSMSSTMDIALMWELFSNCIASSELLGMDEEFRAALMDARERLLPLQIGKHGQLQEWFQDFEEAEPGHRHTAHLYPFHPGKQITLRGTPELAEAVRVTLDRRRVYEGTDTIGWCFAWNINFYARLEDPERAYEYLQKLLGNPFPNLLNAHRHPKLSFYPTTIEANFAATAGIVELLMQSHTDEIHLLPALPGAWKDGRVKGIRARGGYVIDMEWKAGTIVNASIHATLRGTCRLRTAQRIRVDGVDYIELEQGVIEFAVEAGQSYSLIPLSN